MLPWYDRAIDDPWITDEEIIESFTPLEHKFRKLKESGYSTHDSPTLETLKKTFPGDDDIGPKFSHFILKWRRLGSKRAPKPDEFLSNFRSKQCNEKYAFGNAMTVFSNLWLGESKFGGVLTGYSVHPDYYHLLPDVAEEARNQYHPDRLCHAVLAVKIHQSPELEDDLPQPQGEDQRGQESTQSVISTPGADVPEKETLCVAQLGPLMACTGEEWAKARDKYDRDSLEMPYRDWEETGYGVVVGLDDSSHATGPVFVMYGFSEFVWDDPCNDYEAYTHETIYWCDSKRQEFPRIRRLYPACNQKFFLAKIADTMEDLRSRKQFDFEIVAAQRCTVTRARVDRSDGSIIPNDIPDDGVYGPEDEVFPLEE
ncbi:hypothetical protein EDB81DRAFT_878836 [Dactylonectria macrodidyma]|uniref:Uncharacterized protein n=1 Tax=Dactylonectria macrodidyma TaxID=307937 RepID=A0A9P9JNF9_9HYPO|nr:hypothetical protein EDB81DRAFT_878836 [Dactylonectria macrodidyma]